MEIENKILSRFEEFKKYFPDYDFDGNESHKYFLAVKKKSS